MCGIAGFCSLNWNREQVIHKMNTQMINRGPDAEGMYSDGETGMTLGHRRLSIVDLSENGAQPMTSHNGQFVLVYNGEIYNAVQIRDRLIQEEYVNSFRGTSDTEIMLEAFCAYGVEETLKMCKGMFAIALYDKKDKTIVLARDRVGEKPLYYGHVNNTFVFGSDLAVIKAVPDFAQPLSKKAIKEFLRYGYVPAPISIYEGIFKCMPGHILKADYPYQQFSDISYYSLTDEYKKAKEEPFSGTYKEAVDGLENVLKEAVKSQMMADVPLGAFLSGGIDSSVIVSLMQSLSDDKVKTFTIGFEEEKYNEAKEAKSIAEHLGTEHTELVLSENELRDVIPRIPSIFTEPFADSSQIPTFLVSKLARERVTVSLSGDAGDELFCGYNTYWKVADLYNRLKKIPSPLKKAAGNILLLPGIKQNNAAYRSGHCFLSEDIANLHEAVCYDTTTFAERLIHDNFDDAHRDNQKSILPVCNNKGIIIAPKEEMMVRDLMQYHPDDILVKVDRAGMAVSLENRVPMLDKDVLQFAFALPTDYKCSVIDNQLISKRILKDVLYRYVPKELMDRPKKGFSVPLTRWLTEGSVHDWAVEILNDSLLAADRLLDGREIHKLLNCFLKTGQNKGLLWNVIVLEQWYRKEKQEKK